MSTTDVVRERALALAAPAGDDDSAVEELAQAPMAADRARHGPPGTRDGNWERVAAAAASLLVARFRRGHGRMWCPSEVRVLRPGLAACRSTGRAIEGASGWVLVLIGSEIARDAFTFTSSAGTGFDVNR